MQNKMKLFACVMLLHYGTAAGGQSFTGTVVVIAKSQSRIVIAADSRMTTSYGKYDDNFRKIRTLDNHTVFVAAGTVAHDNFGQVLWNAFGQASASFAEAQRSNSPQLIAATARSWNQSMPRNINRALILDPVGSKSALEGNLFLSAAFLGFENNTAVFYQFSFMFDPTTNQAKSIADIEPMYPELHWGAMGRSDTADEVLIGATDFAKAKHREWEVAERRYPPGDTDVRWAIRLVELTKEYDPHRDQVGGPIDAMEITQKGVRWVQRKKNCQ
jgi:Proteasome subunit